MEPQIKDSESSKLERLLQMLKTDPANRSLRHQCIERAVGLGKFDVAAGLAAAALESDPRDQGALFDRATALIGMHDYQGALHALKQLDPATAANPAVQFNSALCYYCLGQFEQAQPLLEACYRTGQKSSGLVRLLVSTYHHTESLDSGLKVADDNQDVDDKDGAVAGVYSLLYLDAGEETKAAQWADRAVKRNPRSIDGRVVLATLLIASARFEEARQMFDAVIEDAPATGRAWIGLGTLALLAQDLPRAQQELRRALELVPDHVGSWHMLAWTQLLMGDLDESERNLQHALQLDRNFAETHGALAAIAAIRGETSRAEHLIEVASRLDPECLSAQFARSLLLGKEGNAAQARQMVAEMAGQLSARDSSALSQLLGRTSGRRH